MTIGGNSDYSGRAIRLEDVKAWKEFFTAKEVEDLWNDSPALKKIVSERLKEKDTDRIVLGVPPAGGMHNETCLERAWDDIQKQLNLAFEKCAEALGQTQYVMMGDGQNAEFISPNAERNANRKRPDYAGYLKNSADDTQYLGKNPKAVFNRIPGDAKQFRHINRNMLPPDGSKYDPERSNAEAQKVLNQIHGYMDQREARYGYIVTNEELICFRRRDCGWGQLEVSEAIRHDVEADGETGVLNSKYALFYLHWKVANDDDPENGWRLRSFGKEPGVGTSSKSRRGTRVGKTAVSVPFTGFIKKVYEAGTAASTSKVWLLFRRGIGSQTAE